MYEKSTHFRIRANITRHVATCRNTSRWPNACNMLQPTMFRYVALRCCYCFKSPSQMIATCQHNIFQHCWPSICKLRLNDHNISAQHIATLSVATCCTRLATLLQRVATCWVLKLELVRMPKHKTVARTWPNVFHIMQHPKMLNRI